MMRYNDVEYYAFTERENIEMTTLEFRVCLEKVLRGDKGALERIYEENFHFIYYTALSVLRDKDEAYDVAMTVVEKLIRYPSDPVAIRNHKGLLYRMTKNASYNFLKSKRFITGIHDGLMASPVSDDLWLIEIVETLSEDEREVFIRHCIWGFSLKEIAKETGKSLSTVNRLYKSVKIKIKALCF